MVIEIKDEAQEVTFIGPEKDVHKFVPINPVGWRVVIRPYRPAEKHGEIALAEETKESEELLTYVGQVVAMGSECFKAVSRSGIDYSKIDPKPRVGDWVLYGTYGGQTVRTKAGVKYLIMNDDGIMGIVDDPEIFRYYI